MHIDWTIHFADLLVMATFAALGIGVMWTFHSRLIKIETWIELEGPHTERMLKLSEGISAALAEVTALYREMSDRVKRNEELLIEHHQDFSIHQRIKP